MARANEQLEILENLEYVLDGLAELALDLNNRADLRRRVSSIDHDNLVGIIDAPMNCSIVTLTNAELWPAR